MTRARVTIVLSLAMLAIGVVTVVRTLAAGGGPSSVGIFLGLAFCGVGAARLWLATKMGS